MSVAATPPWPPIELEGAKHTTARLALSVEEACGALGVGWDFWNEHIAPEVPVVRLGRRKLIPVAALVAWLEANAELALEEKKDDDDGLEGDR